MWQMTTCCSMQWSIIGRLAMASRASAGSSSVHHALAMVLRRRREIYHSLTDDRNERVTFGSSHSSPRMMDRRSKIVASVIAAYWYLRHHISCCWIIGSCYYQQRGLVPDYSLLWYRKSFASPAHHLPIHTRSNNALKHLFITEIFSRLFFMKCASTLIICISWSH